MRRLLLALTALLAAAPCHAQQRTGPDSGLPLPRFVSLKSGKVNMRVGPGREYRVEWEYARAGLPVEIIAEFDKWRRVRDADGTEGWVYGALLSGRRTAVVAPWLAATREGPEGTGTDGTGTEAASVTIDLHADGDEGARVVARLEPGVTARLDECDGTWCWIEPHAANGAVRGWVRQINVWGAYPGETFER